MSTVFPVVESLFLPPGIFILFIIISVLLFLSGRSRAGVLAGSVSVVLLYLFSIAPFADLLLIPLESRYPPYRAGEGRGAGYVVVLGGGIVTGSPAEAGRGSLSPESLKRLVYGVRLAVETKLPLVVSGGIVRSNPTKESEAAVARRTIGELGNLDSPVLIEGKSRNTWENAVWVARDLHPKEVILVTSAYHMPRSVLAFRRNHITVIPAPTDYLADRSGYTFYSYLPGAESLRESAIAFKEYLGYFYYRAFLYQDRTVP